MENNKKRASDPKLPIILIITILFIALGLVSIFVLDLNKFNFHSSKIIINGDQIYEELSFKPDKPYHTLFRTFSTRVFWNIPEYSDYSDSVIFNNLECSLGEPYLRTGFGVCYLYGEEFSCKPYTENNEYGCSFGNELGYLKGTEYKISANYQLKPENLFKINGMYYIKFIIYSPKNHVKLTPKNFVIEGEAIKKEVYFPSENVIVYIPYYGDVSGFKIIEQKRFKFDSLLVFFIILFAILPGILFLILWFIFGKENSYESIPKELSAFPNKRKYWEVAAYFNPPFFKIDKNFFSSVLLKFYNKKIIDIKEKEGETYIKLNKFVGDKIEKQVYDLLEFAKLNLRPDKDSKFIDGEYFNFKGFTRSYYYVNFIAKNSLAKTNLLKKDIDKVGKNYLNNIYQRGAVIMICFFALFIGMVSVSHLLNSPESIYFVYVLGLFTGIMLSFSPLYSKFKGEYYIEYQKWKAFKRYLNNSFSIKTAKHKTLIIWNEYLIYATALGVSKRVIKELKANNLITNEQEKVCIGITTGTFFGIGDTSNFSGNAGGGFSGAGGGGIGGGGGGGR